MLFDLVLNFVVGHIHCLFLFADAIGPYDLTCLLVQVHNLLSRGVLEFENLACLINGDALVLRHLNEPLTHLVGHLIIFLFVLPLGLLVNVTTFAGKGALIHDDIRLT